MKFFNILLLLFSLTIITPLFSMNKTKKKKATRSLEWYLDLATKFNNHYLDKESVKAEIKNCKKMEYFLRMGELLDMKVDVPNKVFNLNQQRAQSNTSNTYKSICATMIGCMTIATPYISSSCSNLFNKFWTEHPIVKNITLICGGGLTLSGLWCIISLKKEITQQEYLSSVNTKIETLKKIEHLIPNEFPIGALVRALKKNS